MQRAGVFCKPSSACGGAPEVRDERVEAGNTWNRWVDGIGWLRGLPDALDLARGEVDVSLSDGCGEVPLGLGHGVPWLAEICAFELVGDFCHGEHDFWASRRGYPPVVSDRGERAGDG